MIFLGNVYSFCRDDIRLIENFDEAITDRKNSWICHHRLECEETPDGIRYRTSESLKEANLYYDRPANELIFLKPSEHTSLHNKYRKIVHSEEYKRKISIAMKGKPKSSNEKYFISNKRPTSVFGKKFKEHYGITHSDNPGLYDREKYHFYKNGKCRWE